MRVPRDAAKMVAPRNRIQKGNPMRGKRTNHEGMEPQESDSHPNQHRAFAETGSNGGKKNLLSGFQKPLILHVG